MAEYEVEDTKTGKMFVIEGPDGATEDELMAFVQNELGEGPEREQGSPVPSYKEYRAGIGDPMGGGERLARYGEGLLDSFTNSFGVIGDELTAHEAALVGRKPGGGTLDIGNYDAPYWDRYDRALEAERGQNKRFAKEFPVQDIATKVAGAYANPLVRRAGAWAMRPASMGAKMGRGALVGAGTGGVYGAAEGEGGLEGRVAHAVPSAILGALLGAGIPPAAAGVGKGLNWAGDRLGSVRDRIVGALSGNIPQSSASGRKAVEAAMRDFPSMSPEEAVAATNQRVQGMGPNATWADAGPNLRGLTAATERPPGAAKTIIRDKIIPRQEGVRDPVTKELQGGQAGRVDKFLNDLVPENTTATRKTLSHSTNEVGKLYDNAYAANQHMDSAEIRRIIQTPLAKRALAYAVERMQNRGQNVSRNDPELTALYRELVDLGRMEDVGTRGVGRGLKLRTLDLLKRSLDDMGQASPTATGTAKGMASDARALAKQLRNELDRLDETAKAGPKSFKAEGGDYARGRALEQKRLRAKDALKDGETFLNRGTVKNPDEMKAVLDDMSPEEIESFRVSFIGALKNKVGNTKRWLNSTRDLFGDKNLEDKINLVFGDRKTFARYIDFLEGSEAPMYETYAAITKGSPTALRLAEDADAKVVPGALMAAGKRIASSPLSPGAWLEGVGKVGSAAIRRMARDPASLREQMAHALMGREMTPDVAARATGAVRLSEANKRALARALLAAEGGGLR